MIFLHERLLSLNLTRLSINVDSDEIVLISNEIILIMHLSGVHFGLKTYA